MAVVVPLLLLLVNEVASFTLYTIITEQEKNSVVQCHDVYQKLNISVQKYMLCMRSYVCRNHHKFKYTVRNTTAAHNDE